MFHLSDLKSSKIKPAFDVKDNVFSLKINKKNMKIEHDVVEAAKPLIYFIRLFGMQTLRCLKKDIIQANLIMKFYSLIIILIIIFLALFLRPISWVDTKDDPPLYILTKVYVILQVIEVVHSIFITSIWSNITYVELFKKLSSVDGHYGINKTLTRKRRFTAIFLIFLVAVQCVVTSSLRKFHVNNILTQFTITCLMLQGIFSTFILLNMYLHLLILNMIISKKINKLHIRHQFIFKDTLLNKIIKVTIIV